MNALIPVDTQFIEQVAKAVGRARMFRDASALVEKSIGIRLDASPDAMESFDLEFDELWLATDFESEWNRKECIADAQAAINKINFLLLTTLE